MCCLKYEIVAIPLGLLCPHKWDRYRQDGLILHISYKEDSALCSRVHKLPFQEISQEVGVYGRVGCAVKKSDGIFD